MTNYEKIKNMSVEEMAKLFFNITWDNCICCNLKRGKHKKGGCEISCKQGYKN